MPLISFNRMMKKHFVPEVIIESPGRINLLGDHTDYNEGYVMPAALDLNMYLAFRKITGDQIIIRSVNMKDAQTITITNRYQPHPGQHWINYVLGCLDQLNQGGYKYGAFECIIGSDIPIGAGLSSSSALECGLLMGISELFDMQLGKLFIVKMAQAAENAFLGLRSGVMDHFSNVFSITNHVLMLDCRSLKHTYHEVDFTNHRFILFDSGVKHSLSTFEFNNRRVECEQAVSVIKTVFPEVKSLRDCTEESVEKCKSILDDKLYRRARFVVRENDRAWRGASLLEKNNFEAFGELMYLSHEGLQLRYEVSCYELDTLVEIARNHRNVLGARMMGGGYGGCTINLIKDDNINDMTDDFIVKYKKRTGKKLTIYKTKMSQGLHRVM